MQIIKAIQLPTTNAYAALALAEFSDNRGRSRLGPEYPLKIKQDCYRTAHCLVLIVSAVLLASCARRFNASSALFMCWNAKCSSGLLALNPVPAIALSIPPQPRPNRRHSHSSRNETHHKNNNREGHEFYSCQFTLLDDARLSAAEVRF